MRRPIPAATATPQPVGGNHVAVVLSLLSLYVIWGSTYLAIRIAIHSIPPFLMAGSRFIIAGTILLVALRLTGSPFPTRREWLGAGAVGILLVGGGNGLVALAEQRVSSGLTATLIATTPLWIALLSGLLGRWPGPIEWVGLGVGFAGVILLNLGTHLHAQSWYAAIPLLAAAAWALGSIASTRLPMPGGMMNAAAEQVVGGIAMLLVSVVIGERAPTPAAGSLWAVLYLIVLGSLVAFVAYNYLLQHVRPTLATSYAYVNPVVAVALGVILGGESVTGGEEVALVVILVGVALVLMGRQRPR